MISNDQLLKGNDDETINNLADHILQNYQVKPTTGLLNNKPFFIALEGSASTGKSTLSKKLQNKLHERSVSLNMNVNIQVFEQDLFLKSREERKKEFTQKCGELGISGNCSGDEY